MTFPGGDSGGKPRDQTGEGVSSTPDQDATEAPQDGPYEAPPIEQAPPPAYEQPTAPEPASSPAYGAPGPPPPAYPPPGGYGPEGYPPPPDPNYPPPPPHYGPSDPRYGSPYPAGGYAAPGPYGYPYPQAQPQQTKTNTMAIASLVMSVLGIVPFCGGILSIVGIVLGTVALNQIKDTRQEGYGLAIAGIVVGVAMLIVTLIWTIFALR